MITDVFIGLLVSFFALKMIRSPVINSEFDDLKTDIF